MNATRVCDTFNCDDLATHRAEWKVSEELRGRPGFERVGYYCDDCAERVSRSSNVVALDEGQS